MRSLGFLVGIILLGGCMAVRTYTIEEPRVDTDMQGNRGYLTGTSSKSEIKKSKLGDTRKISVVEVEFGSSKTQSKIKKLDLNKSNEIAAVGEKEPAVMEKEQKLTVEEKAFLKDEASLVEEQEVIVEIASVEEVSSPKEYENYVIQKNDTLQKISRKFYGTTKKWKMIYNTNKKVVKNPDILYPGTEIKIPPQTR